MPHVIRQQVVLTQGPDTPKNSHLGSSMPDSGLKLMPVHMSTAAPKSMSFTLPLLVTSMFSCTQGAPHRQAWRSQITGI